MAIKIGNNVVGLETEPFIILEAGINHNGDISLAKEMISAAKSAGADAIKFQTFKATEFVGNTELIFTYQSQGKEVKESMLEMFTRYEFSASQWFEIKKTCDEEGILFLSTPQNISDLDLLLEIGVQAIKVGSDDFTNIPLLKRYSEANLPLLISCGMADLGEVYDALDVTGALDGKQVLLMLCTSQYPTPAEDVNLLKLQTLHGAFPAVTLGFSDHTQGSYASIAACSLGACAFEKHFTLDRDLPGPDHWFSENPKSAKEWVSAIRTTKRMLGSPLIRPTLKERDMRLLARRSITALQDIPVGEIFSEVNLGLRRPGNGVAPKFFEYFLNRKARKHINKGQQLNLGDFE